MSSAIIFGGERHWGGGGPALLSNLLLLLLDILLARTSENRYPSAMGLSSLAVITMRMFTESRTLWNEAAGTMQ